MAETGKRRRGVDRMPEGALGIPVQELVMGMFAFGV